MKTAYVLSGGGAKGAFQVGAMQRLDDLGIKPDLIVGTSVGALNAAGYAYQGMAGLSKLWDNIKGNKSIIKLNWWRLLWAKGIYNTKPLKKLLDKVITGIPNTRAMVTVVDLATGKLSYTSNTDSINPRDFKESVLASASMPFSMDPVKNSFVDGGVREVAPLKRAIKEGCEKIYVILTNPFESNPDYYDPISKKFLGFLHHGIRAIDLMQSEIWSNDLQCAKFVNENLKMYPGKKNIEIIVIAPPKVLIDTLEFDPRKIKLARSQGFRVASQVMKGK